MKIADWLTSSTERLTQAGILTARLDCLVLLEDTVNKDRAHILSHPETVVTKKQLQTLDRKLTKRTKHLPLAYIRGKTEFFGRDFFITPDVLEPRPESETMIELLLKQSGVQNIIDVGCGSGALGITAALELSVLPNRKVIALDIDSLCLAVTTRNAELYNITIQAVQSNLLDALESKSIDGAYLLANLPYVPNDFKLNQAAMNEPSHAILGGKDGLDLYEEMFKQLSNMASRPSAVLCESLPTQHQSLAAIAAKHGFTCSVDDDFIQFFS